MGILGGALGISSFLYHATHYPSIRSADIMILWAAAGSGLVQGLLGLWYCGIGQGALFVVGLVGLAMLGIMSTNSMFYINKTTESLSLIHI